MPLDRAGNAFTGNGLKIIAVDSGSNGNAVISGNLIVYTPNAGFTGTAANAFKNHFR